MAEDTREKGTLTVRCDLPAAAEAVQIEVRKPNLTLVGVTSPSRPIQVPVGKYHVRGISASGEELTGEVDIVSGQQAELWLRPDTSEAPPSRPAIKSNASVRSRYAQASESFESFEISTRPVDLRSFTGNVLLGQAVPSLIPGVQEDAAAAPNRYRFSISPGPPCVIQLRMAGQILNLVPPISPRRGCSLEVRRDEQGIACEFRISKDASVFLNAYASGQLEAATTATQATFDRDSNTLLELAEELFDDKLDDPMGAILSGLGLLRMGELERLGEWTDKLQRGLPWSPDVVCVRGEYLARVGEHAQALDVFLNLPARGLPVFADSLSYALNRLQMYLRVKDLEYREPDVARLVQRLQRFSSVSELRSPYVSYAGENPNEPVSP